MNQSSPAKYQYLVNNPEFPYCMGCGHTWINKALDLALQQIQVKPTKVNLVSDIGCVGLVDKLFLTNTIHTTHGRSTAVATGMQLADQILFDNDAIHVIMIGDGGSTIGLLHLVEAAKLNTNITVILHNNFVYGMTGGQNSGLTPENFRTATTMAGNLTPSLHIAHLLEAAHAGFISRKLATDKDLPQAIAEAIRYPGFAIVEIIELCTGYATKWNSMTKGDVQNILENMDSGKLGTITKHSDRKNYGDLYTEHFPKVRRSEKSSYISPVKEISLAKPLAVAISGSAGEGVQFASKSFIEAGLLHGLNVVQKNDNPVTIGTGFSMSELKFSSEEIYYSGVSEPDYILISSDDGLKRAKEFISNIIKAKTQSTIIIDNSLLDDLNKYLGANAQYFTVINKDFRKAIKDPRSYNLAMIGYLFNLLKELSIDLFYEAIKSSGKNTEKIIEAVTLGNNL